MSSPATEARRSLLAMIDALSIECERLAARPSHVAGEVEFSEVGRAHLPTIKISAMRYPLSGRARLCAPDVHHYLLIISRSNILATESSVSTEPSSNELDWFPYVT